MLKQPSIAIQSGKKLACRPSETMKFSNVGQVRLNNVHILYMYIVGKYKIHFYDLQKKTGRKTSFWPAFLFIQDNLFILQFKKQAHDITEILLKEVLNTINLTIKKKYTEIYVKEQKQAPFQLFKISPSNVPRIY